MQLIYAPTLVHGCGQSERKSALTTLVESILLNINVWVVRFIFKENFLCPAALRIRIFGRKRMI